MPNLIIAYDLYALGQNYPAVEKAVNSLGTACKLLNTTWYVKSGYSAEAAHKVVRGVMDANDKLVVVDANNLWASNMPEPCWTKTVCALWNT